MKLVTFDTAPDATAAAALGRGLVGYLADDVVVELDTATTREFFERGGLVPETGRRHRQADVRLRAPIVPKKFFHTAGNFREHHDDLVRVNWSHPVNKGIVFFQNVDAIVGPDESIVYPEHLTKELDYELELAVVIGKSGKFFSADQAAEHIAGYLVFNDITARDIQRREMESGVFSFSKAIDTFCPIGPYIVTADEIDDPHDLDMELRVNGQVRQKSNTGRMQVSIQQLVAYHSPQIYSPGDIITTGTIAGVAAGTDDPFANYLKPGDVVEAEIEHLGVLRNPVVSWRDAYGVEPPSADQWRW
ncbi:fumarylacetoacetate hydrolase [Embleya scabrispora]|uniref:Fumarylacetoacetate hydrolase n=1 Tax=Embleya scabrispora TaxID=159449 RepID=A0A1T3P728_9ACTN|nr:fumarylacetoacetate hydrolase family protein [Embleya scabrispora]OPC84670.1 fumarylacetoacetate hydrolase [Embleya scabrispora]